MDGNRVWLETAVLADRIEVGRDTSVIGPILEESFAEILDLKNQVDEVIKSGDTAGGWWNDVMGKTESLLARQTILLSACQIALTRFQPVTFADWFARKGFVEILNNVAMTIDLLLAIHRELIAISEIEKKRGEK